MSKLKSVNYKDKLFVIDHGDFTSCLGFDVCRNRTTALASELGKENEIDVNEYGTPKAYAQYMRMCEIAKKKFLETGWKSKADLTPQLMGLEGWRVEVIDCWDHTRRFIVGRSTGWMPCHIELYNKISNGGVAVCGAPFKKITLIYKVR